MTSNHKQSRRTTALSGTLVFGLTVAALLPFANKAYYADDTVYLQIAQHIAQSPADFYGFQIDGDETAPYVYEFHRNPPAFPYLLAVAGSTFGWTETALHIFMTILAGFLSLGTYLLARELCDRPLFATALAIASPVVYVSASSIMSEIPMSAFYVWAIYCWVRATNPTFVARVSNLRVWWLTASMTFASAAVLTEYFAITLVPLLIAYTVLERRRPVWPLPLLVIPFAALVAYECIAHQRYGDWLFLHAARFSIDSAWGESATSFPSRLSLGLIHLGGCYIATLLVAPLLWPGRVIYWGVWGIVFACGTFVLARSVANFPFYIDFVYNWPAVIHAGIFAAAGCHILAIAALETWKRRDAKTILLSLWIAGTFLFATCLNWTVNAPVFLSIAPAIGILIARRLLNADRKWPVLFLPVAAGAIMAFCVALGDFYGAEAQRRAATKFIRDNENYSNDYYHKATGALRYYLQQGGIAEWKSVGLETNPGDRVVVPQNARIVPKFHPDIARAWYDLRYNTPAASWVTTMNPRVGAGFYNHHWGPLPYAFSRVPEDDYAVYELGDFRHLPPPGSEGGRQ